MKKITQSILFTLFTILTMYAQEPLYNYNVALISTSGSTETYQVTAIGSQGTPDPYNTQDFNITISSPDGQFSNPVMITSGAYGVASKYSITDITTAVWVNANVMPPTPSTHDIFLMLYSPDVYTDLSSFPTNFNLIQFSIERTGAPAGTYPTIADNDEISVTNLVTAGLNANNSFITDVDGVGTGSPATERYSNATLSIPDVEFKSISFKAFPNPSTDIINVNNPTMKEYKYSIRNIIGQEVGINGTLKANGNTQLSLGNLENAIYFIAVSNGKYKKVLKVLINN